MRRALGSMSPAQLNSRGGQGNGAQRMGSKQPRLSGNTKQQGTSTNALIPGRPSVSRRSSIYNKSAQPRTDTRPINDRAFHQQCIRTLAGYLSSHGYNAAISPKLLQAPTTKDVLNIIQFLFLQIDPNLKFVGKMEEDVPIIFKRLGYPVQISKTALYSAGTPHTWPGLLAALTWLVNLLTATEEADFGQEVTPFDDIKLKRLNDYINKSYAHFLNGDDAECENLDEQYRKQVEEERQQDELEIEKLNAIKAELTEKLRLLKSEPSPLATLESKKTDYVADIGKFNMVITNFQSHKQALEKKRDEKRQELTVKKAEVDSISREIEELRERVAGQEINAADVEKMLKEKQILEVNLEVVTSRKQEVEKVAWELEVQSSKKLRDLEAVVGNYNDTFQRLKLALGEIVKEVPFDMKLNSRADTPEEILGAKLKILKPAYNDVISNIKNNINKEAEEALTFQQQLFAKDVACREKLDQISSITAQNKKLETQYKSLKAKLEAILAEKVADREEIQDIENRIVNDETSLKRKLDMVEQQLKTVQMEYEKSVKCCNDDIEYQKSEGTEILEIILSTKEKAQVSLKKLEDSANLFIDDFQKYIASP